jgi:hypothetical protein
MRIEDKAPHGARILLGLTFTIFGLNGFLQFLPTPQMNEAGGAFLGALAATQYMFPLIKSVEVAAGVALLANRFVPLALVLLAPIVVNIVLFHAVLAGGVGVPLVLTALGLYLAWSHRDVYRPLFQSKARAANALRLHADPAPAE